ncbi:MAG: hypothetical protein JWO59_266, partial [Chloroflexi bacterium]|nr:hypothetical protein [Chloroflexota bacterium]
DFGGLEGRLYSLMSNDPTNESVALVLMRTLAESGRRAAALRVYNDLAAALQAELGLTPGTDLTALRHALLRPVIFAEPQRPDIAKGDLARLNGVLTVMLCTWHLSPGIEMLTTSPASMSNPHPHGFAVRCIELAGGIVLPERRGIDSIIGVFSRVTHALMASTELFQAMVDFSGDLTARYKLVIAVHSGEADLSDSPLDAPIIRHCTRLASIALGGQAVVSVAAAQLGWDVLLPSTVLRPLGQFQLSTDRGDELVYELQTDPITALAPLEPAS